MSLPAFSIWILTFIMSIVTSHIPGDLKKSVVAVLLYLYWRNIHLLLGTLTPLSLMDGQTTLENTKAALCVHFDFKINGNNLESRRPTIFICNYARDRFENLFPLFLPRKIMFMMSELFADISNFDSAISAIIIPKEGSFDRIGSLIGNSLSKGIDVLCYCQKPLFVDDCNYGRIRTGIFKIAHLNNFTITPLYIEPIKTYLHAVYYQEIQIIVGEPVRAIDVPSAILETKTFFKKINESRL